MTKASSWQTAAANHAVKMALPENAVTGLKKTGNAEEKEVPLQKQMAAPHRYSFDDNGGSYRGL